MTRGSGSGARPLGK